MKNNGLRFAKSNRGLTLIEVLIAAVIMAVVGAISYQSLDATLKSQEVVEDNLAKLKKIDRAWLLLEADLRNALAHTRKQVYGPGSGGDIPPMVVENGGDYLITVMRGGHSNPLGFVRSEVIRVGYRLEEDVLVRDVWYDLSSTDQEQARQQKIIENVERVEIKLLATNANSFSAGPWVDRWPQQTLNELPLAAEVVLQLKEQSEIKRVFSMVKGE